MVRLIDADTLNYVRVRIYHDDGTIGGYNAVVPSSEIKNVPTVDAVPVIRCKDCKYYEHGENPSETWSTCTAHINRYIETCAENYCSWAERRTE